MNKAVRKFRSFAEAEKADRTFYKKLSGNERLQLLLELLNHAPEQRPEFLELLNLRGSDYVIVGAHSLAFHGRPRYTGDLDILIRPTPENAVKLVDLLNTFGSAHSGLREVDFTTPTQIIQLGRAPNRIDLLTSISGVTSNEAFDTRIPAELDGIPVFILAKEALIRN